MLSFCFLSFRLSGNFLQALNLIECNLIDLTVCGYQAYLSRLFIDTHIGRSYIVIQNLHHVVAAVIGAGQQIALTLAVADDSSAFSENLRSPDAVSKCSCTVRKQATENKR